MLEEMFGKKFEILSKIIADYFTRKRDLFDICADTMTCDLEKPWYVFENLLSNDPNI